MPAQRTKGRRNPRGRSTTSRHLRHSAQRTSGARARSRFTTLSRVRLRSIATTRRMRPRVGVLWKLPAWGLRERCRRLLRTLMLHRRSSVDRLTKGAATELATGRAGGGRGSLWGHGLGSAEPLISCARACTGRGRLRFDGERPRAGARRTSSGNARPTSSGAERVSWDGEPATRTQSATALLLYSRAVAGRPYERRLSRAWYSRSPSPCSQLAGSARRYSSKPHTRRLRPVGRPRPSHRPYLRSSSTQLMLHAARVLVAHTFDQCGRTWRRRTRPAHSRRPTSALRLRLARRPWAAVLRAGRRSRNQAHARRPRGRRLPLVRYQRSGRQAQARRRPSPRQVPRARTRSDRQEPLARGRLGTGNAWFVSRRLQPRSSPDSSLPAGCTCSPRRVWDASQ
jgi:hypothetical protein